MLILRLICLKFCNPICDALRDLVPFVQFLKRKNGFETFTSWPNNSNNANGLYVMERKERNIPYVLVLDP